MRRNILWERMSNDEYLHPQHNMTELVYALEKGLDNVALVLASGVKVSDILLMCKIFHVEEEKVRLEAKAQEMIEDATPRKRSKLEWYTMITIMITLNLSIMIVITLKSYVWYLKLHEICIFMFMFQIEVFCISNQIDGYEEGNSSNVKMRTTHSLQ